MSREPTGEVRLAWRLILIILLFVCIEVLLRVIPIGILTAFMLKSGMTRDSAVETARGLVFEDPIWSTAIGVLIGLTGFVIVWFLVRVVEKTKFTWKACGLDWRRSSPSMIILGVLLALILFTTYMIIARRFGASDSPGELRMGENMTVFFQKFILFIAMGFGEEAVFRAYIQTRLSARFGMIWGVLGTALVFTLLHQISYRLSPATMLSGVILWTTLGALYYLSKSLYLVGTFHGVMNTLLNTLNFESGDIAALIGHVLALLTLIIFVRFKSGHVGNSSNPAQRT